MNSRPLPVVSVAVVLAAVLHPGEAEAGRSTRLMYQAPAQTQAPAGPAVAVTWDNAREPKKGGKELQLIGNERGSYGIPTAVNSGAKKTQHIDSVVPNWAADCLRAAGYQATVGEAAGMPRLHVTVQTLWSEQIPVAMVSRHETWIRLKLALLPAGGGAALWEKELSSNGGTTTVILRFDDPVEAGFLRAFDELSGLLLGELASPAFQAILPGGDPGAAAAAAAGLGKSHAEEKAEAKAAGKGAQGDGEPAAKAEPAAEASVTPPPATQASLTEKAEDIERPAPFRTWDPLVYQWSGRETIGGIIYGGVSVGLLIAGDQWARKLASETYGKPEISTFVSSYHFTTTNGDPPVEPIIQAYVAEILFDWGVQSVVPVFGTMAPTLIAANAGKDLRTVKAVMGFASVPSFLVPALTHLNRFSVAQRHRLGDIPGEHEYLMIAPAAFSLASGFADIFVATLHGILGALYAADVIPAEPSPGLMPPPDNRARLRNSVAIVPVLAPSADGGLQVGFAGTF